MRTKIEKLHTLELVLNNIANHEIQSFFRNMDSFINDNRVTSIGGFFDIYHELDRLSAICVKNIYDKVAAFPFRNNKEIKKVKETATKYYVDCFKNYSKYIPTTQDIDEKLLSRNNKQAETEIYIGDAILKDKLKNEKQKNWPVILSGIWGVFGAIIGAMITVFLSK